MTDTLKSMSSLKNAAKKQHPKPETSEQAVITELVRAARARGEDITGPEGTAQVPDEDRAGNRPR